MWLDMYLSARLKFSECNEQQKDYAKTLLRWNNEPEPTDEQVVDTEVIYWRKANHIHKWFVDNVQWWEDDCWNYPVAREQLIELKELCDEIIETANYKTLDELEELDKLQESNKLKYDIELAESLLPTQGWFFFWNTDYDLYYYNSIIYTSKHLWELLANDKYKSITYSSSW